MLKHHNVEIFATNQFNKNLIIMVILLKSSTLKIDNTQQFIEEI